jgi:LysM repeat protein
MAIAVVVLVLVVAAAVLILTQLDPGRGTSHKKAQASTTSTTGPATTTTSAPRPVVQYTVASGDTLSSIARRFHVSTGAIALTNKLATPDHLTVGQVLTIPAEVPVRLAVKPASIPPGGSVNITLSGAAPGERVTFQIQTPTGSFKGPVHVAAADGTVATTYAANPTDPSGSYLVVARGDQGLTASAVLVVATPAP